MGAVRRIGVIAFATVAAVEVEVAGGGQVRFVNSSKDAREGGNEAAIGSPRAILIVSEEILQMHRHDQTHPVGYHQVNSIPIYHRAFRRQFETGYVCVIVNSVTNALRSLVQNSGDEAQYYDVIVVVGHGNRKGITFGTVDTWDISTSMTTAKPISYAAGNFTLAIRKHIKASGNLVLMSCSTGKGAFFKYLVDVLSNPDYEKTLGPAMDKRKIIAPTRDVIDGNLTDKLGKDEEGYVCSVIPKGGPWRTGGSWRAEGWWETLKSNVRQCCGCVCRGPADLAPGTAADEVKGLTSCPADWEPRS